MASDSLKLALTFINTNKEGTFNKTFTREDKVILTALNFELVVLVIKLAASSSRADVLDADDVENILEAVTKFMSMHGTILDIDRGILHDAMKMVHKHEDTDIIESAANILMSEFGNA